MNVSREQLYQEVWAEPLGVVSGRYQVADLELARICERLNVPRPRRGHWSKVAAGKRIRRPSLPPANPGAQVNPQNAVERAAPRPAAAQKPAPRTLEHRIIRGTRAHFEHSYRESEGYLRPKKQLLPDVVVSRLLLTRALSLASSLFLKLEDGGHPVTLAPRGDRLYRPALDDALGKKRGPFSSPTWHPARPTLCAFGGMVLGLTIYECGEPADVEFNWLDRRWTRVEAQRPLSREAAAALLSPTKRGMPSGLLAIRAYTPHDGADWSMTWRESQAGDLALRLSGFVTALRTELPAVARSLEEARRQDDAQQRLRDEAHQEWQRRRAEAIQARALKESQRELEAIVKAFSDTRHVDEFFRRAADEISQAASGDRDALVVKLERARQLFQGPRPLDRLRAWRPPEERTTPDE